MEYGSAISPEQPLSQPFLEGGPSSTVISPQSNGSSILHGMNGNYSTLSPGQAKSPKQHLPKSHPESSWSAPVRASQNDNNGVCEDEKLVGFHDPEDDILNKSFSEEDASDEEIASCGMVDAMEQQPDLTDGSILSRVKKIQKQKPLIIHKDRTMASEESGSGSGDRLDANPYIFSRTGVPLAPAPKDFISYRYAMDHPRRGRAVIINNRTFTMENTPHRKGSDNDAAQLQKTLLYMGFEVDSWTDLPVKHMQDAMRYYSNQNYSDCDGFFCAIFSHGEEGIIYGTDGKIGLTELTMPFRGDKCTTLAGKPKVFVIQACRGEKLDSGVDLVDDDMADLGMVEADAPSVYRVPCEADFLYAFSTVSGYFSWRNTELGSWFIQSLCRTLDNHVFDPEMDFVRLLTRVNYEVAMVHESNVPSDNKWHRKKQIPSIVSMLTKDLIFTRKGDHPKETKM